MAWCCLLFWVSCSKWCALQCSSLQWRLLMAHLLARLNLGRIQKILWIWQNPKYPTQYTKMEVTSWYQITLYAFQFMICPSLWNEVQLPNIKIFLKRKWYCPKFGQIFFFSGKHLSPRLQKQHICFAARLGFIAFQGRQSQTNTFSSQIYAFSSCSLLVFSFFKLLRRAFWNMILQHQHLSEGRLHFKLLHLKKMLKRHDLATNMRWAAVQEKWKWTVTKKTALIQELKSESEIRGIIIALAQYWSLVKTEESFKLEHICFEVFCLNKLPKDKCCLAWK